MINSGRTLREWRAKQKLTKQEMSRKLGIHPSTYSKWEEHAEDIRIVDAIRIADVLGCRVSEIVFFEKNPNFKLGMEQMCNL
ncbi:helix-turn-helix transcriptional regulator [Paenibacillus sp. GbtcB18]|uniref:helix-turn-helix transcriptional regulator n=1 Tax=Paenibacillus sp. GbtcB18 TaxID=2824763 RepID=UPI001C30D301|nr:helix-turn-helix transcriptional regulator [Paenibacillus sp. GbtcB18]